MHSAYKRYCFKNEEKMGNLERLWLAIHQISSHRFTMPPFGICFRMVNENIILQK